MKKTEEGRQSFAYPAWIVGIILTLFVAGAYLLRFPPLVELEGRVSDFLFVTGRLRPPEPSPRIVHLDIDDNSLDTVGRWPWPRQRIADAITAIDAMGARVIALDLLLIDPQKPEFTEDRERIEHDRLLAEALAACRAKTVLAVKVDEASNLLSSLWKGEQGRAQWDAMIALLRHDINLPAELVVKKLALAGERAARVRERIHGIKQIVVRQVAEELRAEDRLSVAAMREALLPPDKNELFDEFPELATIRNAVAFEQAAAAVEERLPDKARGAEYPRIGSVLTPLPAFAGAVDLVGVVNASQDGDGQLRRTQLRWQRDRKIYPQFGMAAAFAFLGRPIEELGRPALELQAGVRIRSDEMLLSWPRILEDRPILGIADHVSLGRVIDMLRAERDLARQERARDAISAELIRVYLAADGWSAADLDDPQRRPEVEAVLADQIDLMLTDDDPEDTSPETIAARNWRKYTIEIDRTRLELRRAQAQLRAAIHGKLVFIGWNATGNFGDFYPTAAHERTPGVVAHAVVANSFLTGYLVQESPPWVGAMLTVLLGVAASFVTVRADPRLAFLLTLLLTTVFLAGNIVIVFGAWHTFAATATPLLGLVTGWAGTLLVRAVRERREKAQLQRQFGARISHQLFDFLLENPDQVHFQGEEREVTCFFSDLAGFTGISERLDSKQTVALLNKYMYAMNEELTRLNAYVNKFLGDGVMAVWGAFATDSHNAERACRAALACMDRLGQLNALPEFENLPKLSMRIGIATGLVTVGDCGAPPELSDYTVIGDSANLAARLESANKQFGTHILVNERTHELLPRDLLTRPLGRITVVGQKTPTRVFEVIAVAGGETDTQRDLIERTTQAVTLFETGEFEAARRAWVELADEHGGTPLTELYMAECDRLLAAPDPDFDGVIRLTAK